MSAAPPNAASYLQPQTLAQIASIELRARMVVEGLMTGKHRSPYQGFSVEFAQHRIYTPGDDIRFLDWKVYARTDKLHLKQFQKETNLDLLLLVDASSSMAYSSLSEPARWRKYDHAATLAAAMAYLALRQQDRVGLVLFDQTVRRATRMSNATDHWRPIADTLTGETLDASVATDDPDNFRGRRTDLAALFEQVAGKTTQRSLIVLISDLFDDPLAFERGLARLHHRRHDLIVLQTLDPAELEFPFRDAGDFLGLEGEGRLRLDPLALRRAYLDALTAHLEEVERLTRKYQFDYLRVNTAEPVAAPLSQFLDRRAARLSKRK